MKTDGRPSLKTKASTVNAPVLAAEQCYAQPRSIPWLPQERAYELAGVPQFASSGAKIISVETYTKGNTLSVVRVKTDDGQEGWGQMSTYSADIAATVLHRLIASKVLGTDPVTLNDTSDRCVYDNHKYPWSFVCRALSGFDTAVWDLLGKREGKSVCELLGGKPRPFPIYASSMRRDIKPRDEAQRLTTIWRDKKGARAFKIRIGAVVGNNRDQWEGRTEDNVNTVRKALGDDMMLLVDANSCYTPDKIIALGQGLLADNNVCHLEEPCPYWELEWTAKVTREIKVPVAGGEQDNDIAQWRRMINMKAVDILQPDINYLGGLTRTLRVAQMAQQAGIPVVPHAANSSMITVFSLHLMGAIASAGPHLEFSIEGFPAAQGMYDPALKVVDGKVQIPSGPGWGVTISKKWLEGTTYQITQ